MVPPPAGSSEKGHCRHDREETESSRTCPSCRGQIRCEPLQVEPAVDRENGKPIALFPKFDLSPRLPYQRPSQRRMGQGLTKHGGVDLLHVAQVTRKTREDAQLAGSSDDILPVKGPAAHQ